MWQYAPNGGTVPEDLAAVRTFFARYDHLLGFDPKRELPNAVAIRRMTDQAHQTYQATRYGDVIGLLPPLLTSAESLNRSTSGRSRRDLALTYVSAYGVVAGLLTKLGVSDLATVAADRSSSAAVDADSAVPAHGWRGHHARTRRNVPNRNHGSSSTLICR